MTGSLPQAWPSVDDIVPKDQGGPTARIGFNYQDEIAASFFISMLAEPSILKVHCESHDDIVVKRGEDSFEAVEFVQVKGGEPDKPWSLADLCASPGSSLFEKSLMRDACKEAARFRLVTLRPVVSELRILTYPCYGAGREPCCTPFLDLAAALKTRFPGISSSKGNGVEYWIKHCLWDERHSEEAVRKDNLIRLMKLGAAEGLVLLPEQATVLADELRRRAADAGSAKWIPHRLKKIIDRKTLRTWWEDRLREIKEGAASPSGGKLAGKMHEALLTDDQLSMAVELRRDYARLVRTTRYMDEDGASTLQSRVKSELTSLRGRLVAGQIAMNGAEFHALCLERMDAINAERPPGTEDRSAFLKGCMYDIADRCLHRFSRTV